MADIVLSHGTVLIDDDCACAHHPGQAAGQMQPESRRLKMKGAALKSIPITAQFDLVTLPEGLAGPVLVSMRAQQVLKAFAEPVTLDDALLKFGDELRPLASQLVTLGYLSPVEEDCACPAAEQTHGGLPAATLTAWLHLTDRCNLRCAACYLPHVREDMSPETGRAAIEAVFRSALANGFQSVKLKYAGGEPLLRFAMIEELHRQAQELALQHGLDLTGVVLTNATLLTAEKIEKLKSLGLRLMISLDGLGEFHDSQRPYITGRGSFKDVSAAVELAIAGGLVPTISVTVSGRTAAGLPGVMGWILEHDLPFSLNFYRENDFSVGHTDLRLDEERIIRGMTAAFDVIEANLPRRPFLGGILDRANLSAAHERTCGVGQDYLVFDQNGRVAACQMSMRAPISDINVADPLAIIRADRAGIQNLRVDEKEGCRGCEWKHWCAGGCALATFRATGRYDIKSPNCAIYQALFPLALRLEGLRLLKYQHDPEVVLAI